MRKSRVSFSFILFLVISSSIAFLFMFKSPYEAAILPEESEPSEDYCNTISGSASLILEGKSEYHVGASDFDQYFDSNTPHNLQIPSYEYLKTRMKISPGYLYKDDELIVESDDYVLEKPTNFSVPYYDFYTNPREAYSDVEVKVSKATYTTRFNTSMLAGVRYYDYSPAYSVNSVFPSKITDNDNCTRAINIQDSNFPLYVGYELSNGQFDNFRRLAFDDDWKIKKIELSMVLEDYSFSTNRVILEVAGQTMWDNGWGYPTMYESDDEGFFGPVYQVHPDGSFEKRLVYYNIENYPIEFFDDYSRSIFAGSPINDEQGSKHGWWRPISEWNNPVITFALKVNNAPLILNELTVSFTFETVQSEPLSSQNDVHLRLYNEKDDVWNEFDIFSEDFGIGHILENRNFENHSNILDNIELIPDPYNDYGNISLILDYIRVKPYYFCSGTMGNLFFDGYIFDNNYVYWSIELQDIQHSNLFFPVLPTKKFAYLDLDFDIVWDSGFEQYSGFVYQMDIFFDQIRGEHEFSYSGYDGGLTSHTYLIDFHRDIDFEWYNFTFLGPYILNWKIESTTISDYIVKFLHYDPLSADPIYYSKYSNEESVLCWSNTSEIITLLLEWRMDAEIPFIQSYTSHSTIDVDEIREFSVECFDNIGVDEVSLVLRDIIKDSRYTVDLSDIGDNVYSGAVGFEDFPSSVYEVWYYVKDLSGNYRTSESFLLNIVYFLPYPFSLSSDADSPDIDGKFMLTWDQSVDADRYSVYHSSHPIDNIDDNTDLLASELISLSFPIQEVYNGEHYYIIVAYNEYGNITSNCLQVNVDIIISDEDQGEPSFWDQYGIWIIVAGVAISAGIGITVFIVRGRKNKVRTSDYVSFFHK